MTRQPVSPAAGTIPACAGSTQPNFGRGFGRRDHPRVRGEHITASNFPYGMSGPSPRARGAHPSLDPGYVSLRTIPACAGSTGSSTAVRPATRDHPRVRGEHSQRPANLPVASSRFSNFFRSRQNGRRTQPWEDHVRRIPAGAHHAPAGNPSVHGNRLREEQQHLGFGNLSQSDRRGHPVGQSLLTEPDEQVRVMPLENCGPGVLASELRAVAAQAGQARGPTPTARRVLAGRAEGADQRATTRQRRKRSVQQVAGRPGHRDRMRH